MIKNQRQLDLHAWESNAPSYCKYLEMEIGGINWNIKPKLKEVKQYHIRELTISLLEDEFISENYILWYHASRDVENKGLNFIKSAIKSKFRKETIYFEYCDGVLKYVIDERYTLIMKLTVQEMVNTANNILKNSEGLFKKVIKESTV
jgi:hypothetical protein